MGGQIPDYNLFMICREPKEPAYTRLLPPYSFDTCKESELDIWMAFHFDDAKTAEKHRVYMASYFQQVYGQRRSAFFSSCLFVRDPAGIPVATCFLWKAYGRINTLHWLKVKKECEGKGIGRALLTKLLSEVKGEDLPVYLHTQPSSFRAIKLYSDFGFAFLTDKQIGSRENHLEESLPVLKRLMPEAAYQGLQFTAAPPEFLEAVSSSTIPEF